MSEGSPSALSHCFTAHASRPSSRYTVIPARVYLSRTDSSAEQTLVKVHRTDIVIRKERAEVHQRAAVVVLDVVNVVQREQNPLAARSVGDIGGQDGDGVDHIIFAGLPDPRSYVVCSGVPDLLEILRDHVGDVLANPVPDGAQDDPRDGQSYLAGLSAGQAASALDQQPADPPRRAFVFRDQRGRRAQRVKQASLQCRWRVPNRNRSRSNPAKQGDDLLQNPAFPHAAVAAHHRHRHLGGRIDPEPAGPART